MFGYVVSARSKYAASENDFFAFGSESYVAALEMESFLRQCNRVVLENGAPVFVAAVKIYAVPL